MFAFQTSACSMISSASHSLFGGGPEPGDQGYVKGFVGEVVADEPRAAMVGREVLSAGGDAADAATAVGFALAVTLPSRAGIGGGGACLAYTVDRHGVARGNPEAILFEPPPVRSVGGGDRPAAVPLLARGLYLLHARHGRLPMESLIGRAETLARSGVEVSQALARDLALVAGPLFADPGARSVFGPGGVPLVTGQAMVQPDLAAFLAQLRVAGVGDMYQGALARRIAQVSPMAGVPIGLRDLWTALPSAVAPEVVPFGADEVAFPPNEGGIGAAAAFRALVSQPADFQGAYARSLAAAQRWGEGGVTAGQVVNGALPPPASTPLYPATTTFGTLDSQGNAVICGLTMNNLFGTGRMVPGLGFLAAASPDSVPRPLLAVALAWSRREQAFRAEAGGSGQAGASLAAAVAMANALRYHQPMPAQVPEPGRANVIACSDYLPGSSDTCAAVTDPRGDGLALGGR
jgi:gamma-glutamyltranspeptidase / glutathione hydrolase